MENNQSEITIDAAGRSLGRVATAAAVALRGKLSPAFRPNRVPASGVKIINVAKLKVWPTKLKTSTRVSYSGYPGGLTKRTLGEIAAKVGYREPLRHAIRGMLPKNKLRAKLLLKLNILD